jgi:hypothetical protein
VDFSEICSKFRKLSINFANYYEIFGNLGNDCEIFEFLVKLSRNFGNLGNYCEILEIISEILEIIAKFYKFLRNFSNYCEIVILYVVQLLKN